MTMDKHTNFVDELNLTNLSKLFNHNILIILNYRAAVDRCLVVEDTFVSSISHYRFFTF